MRDFIKTKRNYIIALALLFVFVSLSETTYSLFLKSDTTNEFNYNTGLLNIEIIESEKLVLENTFPVVDSKGIKGTPYVLKLKNTGTIPYLFDLKMLASNEDDAIDYKYIKVSVDDNLPHTLYSLNNVIASNEIIYPDEEKSYSIKIWLDKDTPNNELGKSFIAKVNTTGKNIYKTLDSSGANHPNITADLIPVYYSESDNTWHTADKNNINANYKWYDYDNKMWANAITVKDSDKYIFDITRKNDIKVSDVTIDNGNIIIDNKYLDTNFSNYSDNVISSFFRIKFNGNNDKKYILSNGLISYYYDYDNQKFNFINNGNTVSSNAINLEKNKWYIIGYTYDLNNIKFYVNGNNIGSASINGGISNGSTFKLGTNNSANVISNITIGDTLIYNRILSDNEIKNNYSTSINIINNGLLIGYSEFTPMTLNEYYHLNKPGTTILNKDIKSSYVWIPRFKYMVWNGLGENGVDSYQAYQKGINISFENGTNKSGVINCNNNICYSDATNTTVLSNLDNGKYYTHVAFNKHDSPVTGFWVSKYEISTDKSQNIIVSKDKEIWRNNNLVNYYAAIKNMNTNAAIIKNSEWGAIVYLTHSKYGVCNSDSCKVINGNNTYISGNSLEDSTTGNIYGVFDMSGSASEIVMSSYPTDKSELSLDSNEVSDIPISNYDYEIYDNVEFILGDATKELNLDNGIWHDDTVNFDTGSWIIRGGNITKSLKGIFAYGRTDGSKQDYISTRTVIK